VDGENLVNISVYMADARDLRLPLVGGGDHDWNNLFHAFGLLGEESVRRVAALTHVAGGLGMLIGLAWAGSFLLRGEARARFDAFVEKRAPGLAPLFATE